MEFSGKGTRPLCGIGKPDLKDTDEVGCREMNTHGG